MLEKGEIIKLDGNMATVRFERKGYCDTCQTCKVTKDGAHTQTEIKNTLNVNVGDFVEIDFSEKKLTLIYVCVYLIPLLLVGIAGYIGTLFNKLTLALLCVIALVVGFSISIAIDRIVVRRKKVSKPRMIRILSEDAE